MDTIRHYTYILTYVIAIAVYSINFCFPLFILKKIKFLRNILQNIKHYVNEIPINCKISYVNWRYRIVCI